MLSPDCASRLQGQAFPIRKDDAAPDCDGHLLRCSGPPLQYLCSASLLESRESDIWEGLNAATVSVEVSAKKNVDEDESGSSDGIAHTTASWTSARMRFKRSEPCLHDQRMHECSMSGRKRRRHRAATRVSGRVFGGDRGMDGVEMQGRAARREVR